jgi:hypothetical protein
MTEEAPRGVGDNNPPPYDPEALQGALDRVLKAQEAAAKWKPVAIEDQPTAEKAGDFLNGVRKLWKVVDEARAEQKKPHDEAGKKVQKAFTPLLDTLEKIANDMKAKLKAFADAEDARRKAAMAEAKRLADEAAAAAAREAAMAQARGDMLAAAQAEQQAQDAAKEAKQAVAATPVRIGSATGAGRTVAYRTYYDAEIKSLPLVFNRYRDRPEVLEVLQRLATAEIRAAKGAIEIPGVVVVERKEVA